MASTTPHGQTRYVDFDQYVDSKLSGTRSAIRSTDVMSAIVASSVLVLTYLVLFIIADHWIGTRFLSPTTRLVLGFTTLGTAVVWCGWRIGLPHRRRVSRLYAAWEIEESEPSLQSNLLNLVDLQDAKRDVSPDVIHSIEKRAAVGLSQTNLDSTVDRRQLMRISYVLLSLVVVACIYTLFSPKPIGPSLLRAFGSFSAVPTRTRIEQIQVQTAGDDTQVDASTSPVVPAGFQPTITAVVRGSLAEQDHVTLYYTTADERFVDQQLQMKPVSDTLATFASREFSTALIGENDRGLLQDVRFHITAGDARSETFTIRVSTAPSTTVTSVDFAYPEYMQLDPESNDGGNIDAWEGTTVTFHATASRPVRSARLVFSDTEDTSQRAEETAMRITNGTTLTGHWRLSFRGSDQEDYPRFYRIVCKNADGAIDLQPTLYSIAIRPDKPPEVELLSPRQDLELPSNAVLPLLIRARDPDFQLRYLTLRVEKDGKQLPEHNRELFSGQQSAFGPSSIDFALKPLALNPGDTISYWIEARDNKMPVGNRTNTAPKLNIRITEPVSPDEVKKQRDQARKQQEKAVQDARRQQDEPESDDTSSPQPDDTNRPGEPDPPPGESPEAKEPPANDPESKPEQKDSEDKQPRGGDDPQQGDSNGSDQKGNSSKSDGKDKGETNGQKSDSGEKSPSGNKDGRQPDRKPLSKDGSDDDEAIKRIRDHQRKKEPGDSNSSPERKPEDGSSQPPSPAKGDQKGSGADANKKGDSGNSQTSDKNKKDAKPSSKPMKKSTGPKRPDDAKDRPTPKAGKGNQAKSKKNQKDGAAKASSGDSKQEKPGNKKTAPASKSKSGDSGTRKPSAKSKSDASDPKAKNPSSKQPAQKGKPKPGTGSSKSGDSGQSGDEPNKDGKKKSTANKKGSGDSPSSSPEGKKKGVSSGKKPEGSKKKGGSGSGKKGAGESGSKAGKPSAQSDKPGEGTAGTESKTGTGGTGARPGTNDQGEDPTGKPDGKPGQARDAEGGEDPVNEAFTKQAANLVLKRIEDDLRRGKVDPELLKRLGWNKDDMKKFSSRLRKQLDTPDSDSTPEANARRRQLDELLKSVNVPSRGARRVGRSKRKRTTDALNAQDLPVPLQFREAVKLYRRNLTRRKSATTPKGGGRRSP